jgi:hypothetical protein
VASDSVAVEIHGAAAAANDGRSSSLSPRGCGILNHRQPSADYGQQGGCTAADVAADGGLDEALAFRGFGTDRHCRRPRGLSAPAYAEKRVALVVGNNDYRNVPKLQKAVNDARTMGDTLKQLGFTVMVAENQNRQAFSQTLLAFDRAVEAGDTAFFFYAGHGFEIAGQNFLLPTDVPAATEGQEELVRDASVLADRIIERLQNRKVRTAILVFDACRNNPFERAGTRAVAGGGGLRR